MKANFKIACQRENLYEIRRFVRKTLEPFELSNTLQYRIVLAVDEACSNAIIHGNLCDEYKQLHLEIELKDGLLKIEIYDVGNYSQEYFELHRDKKMQEHIEDKDKGGLGLKIIYTIMDDVRFYTRNNFNVCHLSKVLA